MVAFLAQRNRFTLQTVIDRLFMRLSKSTRVDGLWVGAIGGDALALERVLAALDLIRTLDGVRYRRIICDLKQIWVTVLPGALGQYRHETSTCLLDDTFVQASSVEAVASVIIHEATHARLHHFGYREETRLRIESICVRRQLAFARRHPENEDVLE